MQEEYYDILNTFVFLVPTVFSYFIFLCPRFQRVMHSVLATRIMLHVRETAALNPEPGVSVNLSTSLSFGTPHED